MAYPLGWQSWSPPNPVWPYLPRRDYCPVSEVPHLPAPAHALKPPITYWCSWYALGKNIHAENLLNQAQLIRKHKLPIDYFLIDDGWHDNSALLNLSRSLHALGFRVGLWYAPFTRHAHLPLNPTLDHLINDYKLDLLKLDFLYRPYFAPHLADDSLPHQTLVTLFSYLQTHYLDLYTIACGSPFAPALGRVDAIRFSKDTTFPPPVPFWARRLLYGSRLRLLSAKYDLIPADFTAVPDPDVRLFSLDDATTSAFWDKISGTCLGLGDDISLLSPSQIEQARLWLQKNLSSVSSSPRSTRAATSPNSSVT